MSRLKSYHFDCGNSTNGPVGMCARVQATSKKEAVTILNEALPETEEAQPYAHEDAIEYINFYTGTVKESHIDDWDYVEKEEDNE